MTSRVPARLPGPVREWVEALLGPIVQVSDVSWEKPTSRVWRVLCRDLSAFVKISQTAAAHRREVHALRDVFPDVGLAAVPHLLGSADRLQCLATTEVRGDLVRSVLSAVDAAQQCVIHREAGRVLGDLHRRSARLVSRPADAAAARAASLRDLGSSRLAACRDLVSEQDLLAIEVADAVVAEATAEVGLGVTVIHGDFQPRNWLWSREAGLGLIDFEESQIGFAAEDMGWLFATTWQQRPDLMEEFLEGYGRSPGDDEWRFLAAYSVLGSFHHIADGKTMGITKKIDDGMRALHLSGGVLHDLVKLS